MKKRIVSLLVALVMCLGLFAGCTGVDVTPIATIGGEKVLKGEYLFYCEQLGLQIVNMYVQYGLGYDEATFWDQPYTEGMTMGDYVKTAAKEQVIEVNVLVAKAKELGITLTAEEKEAAKDNKKALVTSLGSVDAYKDFQKRISLSDREILEICEELALAEKVRTTTLAENEQFTSITEETVGKYYEENYFKAKHILVMNSYQEPTPTVTEAPVTEEPTEGEETAEVTEAPTEAPTEVPTEVPADAEPTMTPEEYKEDAKIRAEVILERVLAGEDFDTLMAELSEDPGSKTSPEGYVFTEGKMVTEFEDAVKALAADEVTEELVESSYGWHIIKRLALTSADEDFTENYDTYLEAYQNTVWVELLAQWKTEIAVEFYDDVQGKVDLKDLYWGIF